MSRYFNAKEFARAQAYDAIMARQRGRAQQPQEKPDNRKMTFFVKTFSNPTGYNLVAFCSEGGTFQYIWDWRRDETPHMQLHRMAFTIATTHKLNKLELLILNQQFLADYGETLAGILKDYCLVEPSFYNLKIDNIAPGKKIARFIEKHYPQAKEITDEKI